jgi:putative FmdB family regulatory protein
MPIYEYACKSCGHQFEALVLSAATTPTCTSCGGLELERLISLPHVKSSTTEALAMRAARKRDQAQATDRNQAQSEYEKSHDSG